MRVITVRSPCSKLTAPILTWTLNLRDVSAPHLPADQPSEREDRLWSRVRRFLAEFKKRNGAITCRELLGVDTFSREGREEALRRNLFAARCQKYIRDGIEILDSLES